MFNFKPNRYTFNYKIFTLNRATAAPYTFSVNKQKKNKTLPQQLNDLNEFQQINKLYSLFAKIQQQVTKKEQSNRC